MGDISFLDSFSERALRMNALALAGNDIMKTLCSDEELRAVQKAARDSPPEEIDRLLGSKAHIQISINPEARITADRIAERPATRPCSKPSLFLIRVLNQGYVTAPLSVLVGQSTSPAVAALAEDKLSGAPVEYRLMQLSIRSTRPVDDITLVFSAGSNPRELGGEAKLSVLVACVPDR